MRTTSTKCIPVVRFPSPSIYIYIYIFSSFSLSLFFPTARCTVDWTKRRGRRETKNKKGGRRTRNTTYTGSPLTRSIYPILNYERVFENARHLFPVQTKTLRGKARTNFDDEISPTPTTRRFFTRIIRNRISKRIIIPGHRCHALHIMIR